MDVEVFSFFSGLGFLDLGFENVEASTLSLLMNTMSNF